MVLYRIVIVGVLFAAATSRSDVATDPTPSSPRGTGVAAIAEPLTEAATAPAAGSETPPKEPFQPYGIGPANNDKSAKPFWSYNDLNGAEKVLADKNRDTSNWDSIHNAYGNAIAEQAHRAAASSSQAQLGIDNLAGLGVVP